MKLTPVLSDVYLIEEVERMNVFVLQIEQKKVIKDLVSLVSRKYVWNQCFSHLKRVRQVEDKLTTRYQIILTKQVDEDFAEIYTDFSTYGDILVIDVPAKSPLTRQQFEKCRLLWPTNFHENKYVSRCIDGTVFDDKCRTRIKLLFEKLSTLSQNGTRDASLAVKQNDVIAESTSDSTHPLKHAVICLVNCVAQKQVEESCKLKDEENEDANETPYLLTNCDVFLTNEPCIMCSMALAHSRIRRLFFKRNNKIISCPPDAAITSIKLHAETKLNHRYEAWKVEDIETD